MSALCEVKFSKLANEQSGTNGGGILNGILIGFCHHESDRQTYGIVVIDKQIVEVPLDHILLQRWLDD